MSRVIEAVKHFLVWLGRAVGLTKRPLPVPPLIPYPNPKPVEPTPTTPLRFYGPFIPQWGSFDYREQVTFDFRFQIHGCGSTAQKYGIKDPVEIGILFSLVVTHLGTGTTEPVYTKEGHNIGDRFFSVEKLYWIPGRDNLTHLVPFKAKRTKMGCGTTVPPIIPGSRPVGAKYRLKLTVKALNGQSWGWEEVVEVAGGACG